MGTAPGRSAALAAARAELDLESRLSLGGRRGPCHHPPDGDRVSAARRSADRGSAPRGPLDAARPALPLCRGLLRQPADGADRSADRRGARGQPEHDVPAAALARGARPRRGGVGASRAPIAPLLPDHGRRAGRARAARRRTGAAARADRAVDRRDPRRGPGLMGRATASVTVPGRASDAEALWYDPIRWPAWIDGFSHVIDLSPEWPAAGTLKWTSKPGGRGLVLETVTAYEPRSGQTLSVEDERLRGTQRVEFA